MNELWIINGRVIDPSQGIDGPANLVVADGKVEEVGVYSLLATSHRKG